MTRMSMVRPLLLAVLLAGGARAASLDTLRVPGLQPLAGGEALVSAQLLAARTSLSGTASSDPEPWPCAGRGILAGNLPPGRASLNRALTDIRRQGWTVQRRVPDTGGEAVQLQKGPVTLIGSWLDGSVSSSLVLCTRAVNWRPPRTPPATPRLGDFQARVAGWTLGPRAVRAAARGGDDLVRLVARGEVAGDGLMRLRLPAVPDPRTLRPIGDWSARTGVAPQCVDGPVRRGVSASRATRFLLLDSLDVLNTVYGPGLPAGRLLAAPVSGTLGALRTSGGVRRQLSLIYTSGPVVLRGTLGCTDESGAVNVSLRLPGGWSAYETISEAGRPTRIAAPLPGALRRWQLR